METVMRFLQEVLAFLVKIMSSSNELLVITVACILSIIGFIVLYKKGTWLGVPLSLSGILMILLAILAKIWN